MQLQLINSFRHAFRGIRIAWKEELNMRIHVCVALCVFLVGLWLRFNDTEWVAVILVSALVISLELINSAGERLADASQPRVSPHIRSMKDMLAASVCVASLAAIIIGTIIITSRIITIFFPRAF